MTRRSPHSAAPSDGVFQVLRYLGPWGGAREPGGIARTVVALPRATEPPGGDRPGGDDEVRAYVYVPTSPRTELRGAFVMVHGLHFMGPEDARMQRFCRVLAAAGHIVVAPFLPRALDLVVSADTTEHVDRAVDLAESLTSAQGLPPPALFTISFGSLPGMRVGARRSRDKLSALVLFGGYARFRETLRFALMGETPGMSLEKRDPLNGPAVFLNLLQFLPAEALGPDASEGRDVALSAALREMARRTWGRLEMRTTATRRAVADEVGAKLRGRDLELFTAACGFADASALGAAALLAAGGDGAAFADPRPALAAMKAPVFILHGRDDDVIPFTETEAISAHLPPGHPHAILLSGMHGHTGAALPRPRDLARELRVAVSVSRVFAGAAVDPDAVLSAIRTP